MRRNKPQNRSAFTLVELLVVIAIIMILIALFLPMARRMHQSAQNQVCKSNLRQIGMALRMYIDDNRGRYPDPYTLGGARYRRLVGERDPDDPASLPETYGLPALLHPYLKANREQNVWNCPAAPDIFKVYKITYCWWPPSPRPISDQKLPNYGWHWLLIWENYQYLPYKPGVPAPLKYPPGYENSSSWTTKGDDTPILPMPQWQGGPHYYRRDTSSPAAVEALDGIPPAGYSHRLHADLSIHIWRHYRLVYFGTNAFEYNTPDFVE